MSSKSDNIAELELAVASFRARIINLPDEAWHEQWLGHWNLSQLLAHMAGWAKEMTGALGRVAAGQRPTPEGVDYGAADAWNAKFAATASPGRHQIAAFDLRFKEYLEAARQLEEEQFGKSPEGKLKIGSRLLDGAGIHHFAEHGAELDAWLARRK